MIVSFGIDHRFIYRFVYRFVCGVVLSSHQGGPNGLRAPGPNAALGRLVAFG
jgi:hypothetical protein